MDQESEEIKNLSQEIIRSLESDSSDGINSYVSILTNNEQNINTFDQFSEKLQKTLKKCTCQASWNSDQLIVHCLDCEKSSNSCICVDCFLKGNHKGHRFKIVHSLCGCCDCGDLISWKKSGFCCDHPGPESNPELTQLDKTMRIKIISVSMSAFHYCLKFAEINQEYFNNLIKFLTQLISIGDATRRCVGIAFCQSIQFFDFYTCFQYLDKSSYELLHSFFTALSSDYVFRSYGTISFYRDLPKIIELMETLSYQYLDEYEKPSFYFGYFFELTFYLSTKGFIEQLIRDSKIEWFTILNDSYHYISNFESSQMTYVYMYTCSRFAVCNRILTLFLAAFSVFGNKDDKIIEFVENLAKMMSSGEYSLPFTRIFGDKRDDLQKTQLTVFENCFDEHHFISKISSNDIFTTKPLFQLKKLFESDKFKSIDNLINDYQIYYHSVLSKNVQIYQTFSTHLLAFCCLNLKEGKTLVDYISEVTDNVETFIKRWAVIPLRYFASALLYEFGFFVRNPDDTLLVLESFKYKKNIKYTLIPIFVLIQSLLKATKNCDKFLFMIVSTFDLTVIEEKSDKLDFDDNQKRLILFCIFHFISCLLFDHLCIERNIFNMQRLKIISDLMEKNLTFEEIENVCFKDVKNDDKFYDDLKSYTSRETTKNGTIFHLTDNIEWHPLLPFIEMNQVISLIQNFINKNNDSLINFPEIPKGSEYLLFSPTLWALEYCILDSRVCKDYKIIHQLIFNVLIATAKNSESFCKEEKNADEETLVIQADEFEELIEQLKPLSFNQFMRKKIIFNLNHDEGVSMIDLISGMGNIGITVLKRMGISDIDENLSDESLQLKDQLQKKNRERANRIKMQMMSSFQQKQKTFQSSAPQFEESNEKVPVIECNICHIENQSDCFVYPALICKSSLSSYMKWKSQKDTSNVPHSFAAFNTVHICMHPIHSHCIHDNDYFCPADRCKRNASLPILDGIFDFRKIESESLLAETQKFVKKAYFNDIKFAAFSLASEIEVLEMRHRSNPNCFDNKTIAATLRNIYLCIWQVLHKEAQKILTNEEIQRRKTFISKEIENGTWNQISSQIPNLPEIEKSDSSEHNSSDIHFSPLMKYILFSMDLENENENCHFLDMNKFMSGNLFSSEIQEIDSKINDTLIFKDLDVIDDLSDDYKKFQFLRCAAIFDHFSRCQKITQNEEFIDWDDILSSSFLHEHYNIKHEENENDEEVTLPMFSFFDVPNNFLDFLHPPFSLPILTGGKGELAICLLTGNVVSLSSNSDYEKIPDYLKDKFDGSFGVFLALNGKKASQVFVSNKESQLVPLKSFYVNKFDDIDIGIVKGYLLFLNDSKREETIDQILSGKWTDYLAK